MDRSRPLFAALAVLTALGACRSRPTPRPAPDARPSLAPLPDAALASGVLASFGPDAAVAAPPADASRADVNATDVPGDLLASLLADPATSWSDPRMLAALAADCNADNPGFPEDPRENPLYCFFRFAEQSCSFDPCIGGEHDPCQVDCGRRCESCSAGCRARCGRCQARCDGGACPTACARSCAACLTACVGERDRCATAVCAVRYAACAREKAAAYRANGCAEACARCQTACQDRDDAPECEVRCLRRRSRCTEEQRDTCMAEGPAWGARYLDASADDAADVDVAALDAGAADVPAVPADVPDDVPAGATDVPPTP